MIRELFVNAAIMIASMSIGNQILINKEIKPSSPLKLRIFFSIMSAILGIILMFYSVDIMPNVIEDFRNVPIALSALYCGFTSAFITGIVLSLFRLFFHGITFTSIIAALNILFVTTSCAITILLVKKRLTKWLVMGIFVLIFPTINFILVINRPDLLYKTLLTFWASTIIAWAAVYIYSGYIDVLRFSYQKFHRESFKDHRTGLYNVRQFDKELNKIVNGLNEHSVISLLYIDIDFFKKVNDVYGHQNGDKVLEDLGKILLNSTNVTDIVSRNGGEEFSVILKDCPKDQVLNVAERIRQAVEVHPFELLDGKTINITISVGVAIYPEGVQSMDDLVERADSALYEAKRTGRNKIGVAEL